MNEDLLDPSGAARLYSVARALTGALTAVDVAKAVFARAADLLERVISAQSVAADRPDDVAMLALRRGGMGGPLLLEGGEPTPWPGSV